MKKLSPALIAINILLFATSLLAQTTQTTPETASTEATDTKQEPIQPTPAKEETTPTKQEIVTTAPTQKKEKGSSSSLSLSYVSTSGNSKTQTLGANLVIKVKRRVNNLRLKAGTIYGQNDGEKTSEYWYVSLKDEYDLNKKTYLFALLDLEGNRIAGYGLRANINPGVGYRFITTERHELLGELGPGYTLENRITGDDLEFASGRAYGEYSYKITDAAEFAQDVEYLHSFEVDNNFRVNAETSLTLKISTKVSIKTSLKIKYVNTPPTGNETTDIFSSTALVITF